MNDIVYLCINYYFIGTIYMYAFTVVSTYYVDQFLSVCLWNFINGFYTQRRNMHAGRFITMMNA